MAFQDAFTEASSDTDLAAHTPTTGTAWTILTGTTNDLQAKASTDRVARGNTLSARVAYACDDQGSANHYTQMQCVLMSNAGGVYVAARLVDTDNFIGFYMNGTGATGARLMKYVSGTKTDLVSFQGADATVYKVECNGTGSNNVRLYAGGVENGSSPFTITDVSTSETTQGIVAETSAGTSGRWDDFEAAAVSSGATTILPSGFNNTAIGAFSVLAGDVVILPSAKGSDEAFGTWTISSSLDIIQGSKGSDEAFGTHNVITGTAYILPSGKSSDEAFGAFSINLATGSQYVYPSGYFDSAIGSFTIRPDQIITFSGADYSQIGQFLLTGTAVLRAKHFFDWIWQQPGLTGSTNDKLYAYLRAQGFSGSVPSMMFLWLRSLGYTGNTPSMITAFERDYTSRWH